MSNDDFIDQTLASELRPGETIELKAFMVKAPPLWLQILLLGGLIAFLLTTAYYVALTNQRLILIQTKMGLFGPGQANKGISSIERSAITKVEVGGLLNNRSMTFKQNDGKELTLRIAPWFKNVKTQGQFFEEVPKKVGAIAG